MTWAYGVIVLDLEPRGPLPTEIYWRRRGLALGIAVVVIGIAVAIVIAFMGSSAGAKPANVKAGSAQNTPAAPPPQAPPPPGQEGVNPLAPPQQGQNPESPTPTAAVLPPPVLKEGDDCPDSTLAVKGLTNAHQYFIGDQPKFTMVVTNIGLVSCKRDVGAAVLAAFVVFAPGQVDRVRDLRDSMHTQAGILADLHDITDEIICRPVAVPNHRPVPHVALWTGIPPGEIVSAQLEQPASGAYIDPANPSVERNFTLDPKDPKRLTARVPPGFAEVAKNRSWRLYTRECER